MTEVGGNPSTEALGTQRSEVNPNPHEAERRIALEAALRRQTDNMAFVLNRVDLYRWTEKFEREVAEDRALLTTKTGE